MLMAMEADAMLVLTRKVGEVIWVGDDVKVTVCRLENGQVRIGIDAPIELSIDRDEVRRAKKAGDGWKQWGAGR